MSRPATDRPSASKVFSHLGVMVAVSVILGVVGSGLAIPFAGVLGVAARSVDKTIDDLPQELDTAALPQRTKVLDADGNTVTTIYDQNRVNVPLSQISRTMVKAIVAIEDYRFYQHGALDLKGTVRALFTNQASSGVVQGGSSITQQMVKLTLLSEADTKEEKAAATEETYARKLRELRYAIAVEKAHSKDWILERYLNIAYFGDGAYGIQAAAKHYFDVNAKRLNLVQSALLAGLVQNPSRFDPTNYADRARTRRDIVLDRMAQLNVIDDEQATKAKQKNLGIDPQPTPNGCLNSTSPFFCDYMLNYLLKDKALGKTVKERKKLLYNGGLTIKTTLKPNVQKATDQSVADYSNPTDPAIVGLASVEPGTGNVEALSQSRPMGRDSKKGETFLNYVVPEEYGGARGFQAGSTFKAFVLAAAIDDGISLSTPISSPSPFSISESEFEDCDGEPYGYGTWTLQNSTGTGTFNLYSGTRLSVNSFFSQLEARTGICKPYRLAKAMGVDLTNPTGDTQGRGAERIPSFTLGVADVSPLEMAEAYATFGARGLHCDSRPVTSIEDAQGNVLKKYPTKCNQVMQKTTADAVSDILRGVLAPGGFADAQALTVPSAGKTGTTNDNFSVWFVGYTPTLATASMVAGANQSGQPDTLNYKSVGGYSTTGAAGSTVAGPIWGQAMRAVAPTLPDEDFVYPSTVSGAGQTYVPSPDPPPSSNDNDNGGGGNDRGGRRGGR